jgi:hypothetical protein
MRRHVLLTMIIGLALTVPAPLGVVLAQSTGPGTHKDEAGSVTGQGLGNERSSERTGSSATVDQGLTGKKKSRKGKARNTRNKSAKAKTKNKSTEFRDGSGLQSGSTGANSAPTTSTTTPVTP